VRMYVCSHACVPVCGHACVRACVYVPVSVGAVLCENV